MVKRENLKLEYRDICPLCSKSDLELVFEDWQKNKFVKCTDCGLVIQNPYTKAEYEENYWREAVDPDGTKRNLFLERSERLKNWYGSIVGFINKQNPGKILDVGCGPGFLLSAIDSKHKKYGIEVSDICIKYIRENYPEINVQKTLIDDKTFQEEYFDIIVLYHIVEHLEHPLKFLTTISKILNKEGLIIIGTPNIESFCAKRFKGNFRLLGKTHLTMFSEKTLLLLLNNIGFQIVKKEFPFFRTDYFTIKNLLRLWDASKLSPPFYKNIMTFYARKK